jgi:hypothetical protein
VTYLSQRYYNRLAILLPVPLRSPLQEKQNKLGFAFLSRNYAPVLHLPTWKKKKKNKKKKKKKKSSFAKLRKAAISFVMSVCSSAWNHSDPTGMIFMKFYA